MPNAHLINLDLCQSVDKSFVGYLSLLLLRNCPSMIGVSTVPREGTRTASSARASRDPLVWGFECHRHYEKCGPALEKSIGTRMEASPGCWIIARGP